MRARSLWCGLVCALLWWGSARAEVQELRQARALITLQGAAPVPSNVDLPYHWDRRHPGLAGAASFEIDFAPPATAADAYAIYIPRLGNAYEVWLNGNLLDRKGDLSSYNGSDFAKVPRYIPVATDLLKAENRLLIRVRADVGRRGGLAAPVLGPDQEVRPLFQDDHLWRVTGTIIVVVLSFMVGMVALALWFT
ncbi:MAG: histidine kinase, partial [Polaromonas sp.]|nr:histidine kinase [Polaromonas sp.]